MQPFDRDTTLRAYWKERLRLHIQDSYRGRSLVKFPEDLRTYQHVIERTKPDTILELGTWAGGSAVWFLDQLRTLVGGDVQVVTVDIEKPSPLFENGISFVWGDLRDAEVISEVHRLCAGRRTMVVEDSLHTFDVTLAALRAYEDLVRPGSYFVIEDGVIDEPDLTIWDNTGVQPAIEAFMATEQGSRFEREWLAPYGLTMHFGGWLKAIR